VTHVVGSPPRRSDGTNAVLAVVFAFEDANSRRRLGEIISSRLSRHDLSGTGRGLALSSDVYLRNEERTKCKTEARGQSGDDRCAARDVDAEPFQGDRARPPTGGRECGGSQTDGTHIAKLAKRGCISLRKFPAYKGNHWCKRNPVLQSTQALESTAQRH
jgi:hypothetical protein